LTSGHSGALGLRLEDATIQPPPTHVPGEEEIGDRYQGYALTDGLLISALK